MATTVRRKRGVPVVERLFNRELSFLDYDARAARSRARRSSLPLLERVFFLKVFAEMLDEFFMVRVAGLTGQAAAGVTARSPDGRTPQQTLAEARTRVIELVQRQSRLWADVLCPALAAEGIVVDGVDDLNDEERAELDERFESEIYPVLTPLAVGPGQPFPYISAALGQPRAVRRGLRTRRGALRAASRSPKVSRASCRSAVAGASSRSSRCSRTTCRASSPGWRSLERSLFRVTRDADLEVSDEADDLLEAVELELRRAPFRRGDAPRGGEPRCRARCASSSSRAGRRRRARLSASTGCSTSPTSSQLTSSIAPT